MQHSNFPQKIFFFNFLTFLIGIRTENIYISFFKKKEKKERNGSNLYDYFLIPKMKEKDKFMLKFISLFSRVHCN